MNNAHFTSMGCYAIAQGTSEHLQSLLVRRPWIIPQNFYRISKKSLHEARITRPFSSHTINFTAMHQSRQNILHKKTAQQRSGSETEMPEYAFLTRGWYKETCVMRNLLSRAEMCAQRRFLVRDRRKSAQKMTLHIFQSLNKCLQSKSLKV